jgi:hypothetical protein
VIQGLFILDHIQNPVGRRRAGAVICQIDGISMAAAEGRPLLLNPVICQIDGISTRVKESQDKEYANPVFAGWIES